MDKLIFNGEGWPLTQESLEQIEKAYAKPITGLTKALGDNLILTGLEDDGNGGLTAGYIVFNQELLPFEAGVEQANAVVVEETVNANYDNDGDGNFGTNAPVWKKRYAKFAAAGSGVADIDFSTLRRYRAGVEKKGIIQIKPNDQTVAASGDFSSIVPTNEVTLVYSQTYEVFFTENMNTDDYLIYFSLNNSSTGGFPMSFNVYEKRNDGFKFSLFRALADSTDISLQDVEVTQNYEVSIFKR